MGSRVEGSSVCTRGDRPPPPRKQCRVSGMAGTKTGTRGSRGREGEGGVGGTERERERERDEAISGGKGRCTEVRVESLMIVVWAWVLPQCSHWQAAHLRSTYALLQQILHQMSLWMVHTERASPNPHDGNFRGYGGSRAAPGGAPC